MSDWIPLVTNLGIPVVIVIFFGVCIWRGAPWVADKVILPFVNRGLKLMDTLITTTEEQSKTMKAIGDSVKDQSETMKTTGVTMIKMATALEKAACRAINDTNKKDQV